MLVPGLRSLLTAGLVLAAAAPSLAAPEETFFGEDLNPTDDPGTVADDPVPLTTRPRADAARASFLGKLTGVATESFDGFAGGTGPALPLTFGSDTATLSGAGNVLSVEAGLSFNGVFPTSGSNVYFLFLPGGSSSFSVAFTAPQAAFGFYATDVGDGSGQLVLRLHRPDGSTSDVTVPSTVAGPTGSIFYFGVIDPETPFDSVTFTNTGAGDGFGFDDLTIGRASQFVPTIDSFFLPKKVANRRNATTPSKSVLKASGFFDTGSKVVDLTAPATLSIGTTDFAVPGLTAAPDGRTFTYQDAALRFIVVKNPFGSSRAKFRLEFKGDLGASVPTEGDLDLRFRNDAVDGRCRVTLTSGGFRIGKKRGALLSPNLFVVRSHASVRGPGKDAVTLIVGLATNGTTPASVEDVRVEFGAGLSATIPGASFTRSGDKFSFAGDVGGVTKVTLDYLRETAVIVGKGLDLGALTEGQNPLRIVVGFGDANRGVSVRVARKKSTVKY